MGVSAHIDDNAEICKACEDYGIRAYRVRTHNESHKGYRSFANFTEAMAALRVDIRHNPKAFEREGATFQNMHFDDDYYIGTSVETTSTARRRMEPKARD